MTPGAPATRLDTGTAARPLARLVCAVDSDTEPREAARQARLIADDAQLVFGSTTSTLIRRSPRPVLVARTPLHGRGFPGRIIVAVGGRPDPAPQLGLAAKLAGLPGVTVLVVNVGDPNAGSPEALALAFAAYREEAGVEPLELLVPGDPADALVGTATCQEASLIVTGRRDLRGPHALFSVSERVAKAAPCSVLVMRGV
jgi:nucleotide-binding universal stress UspA family protein